MPQKTAIHFSLEKLLSPLGKSVNAREVGVSVIKSSSSELWLGMCNRHMFLHASERISLNVVHENTLNK